MPIERRCEKCGKLFSFSPSTKRRFCGTKCSRTVTYPRHGMSRTRLYQIWSGMKGRCFNHSSPVFSYYGGRGITVCSAWRMTFEVFRDWAMANGYQPHLSLDRRDVNGGYSPGNCRWATRQQQMRNTRKRRNARTSKFKGVSRHSQNSSWRAQGYRDGKPFNIGSFRDELAAALAYDDWAVVNYGGFARVNFPERKEAG